MATINSRSGKLQVDFRYQGKRCRETTKFTDTPANRKKLQNIIERMEAEILLGSFVYRNYFPKSKRAALFDELERKEAQQLDERVATPFIKDFALTWFETKKIEWRHSYQQTTMNYLTAYIIPRLGEKRVGDITRAEILDFRSSLAKEPNQISTPMKATSINKIMMPLRIMLEDAADRYDFTSPFKRIKSLKVERTSVKPFTLDEVMLFINNVREDFKDYYTVRFFTGMRTGEIDGLQWKYVDFERREILIRETYVRKQLTYTKNNSSQRDIYMSQPVYDALKRQYEVTGHRDLVFCNRAGGFLIHKNITNRVWYPLLEHLGLEKRVPYQTRHTAATLWLAAGEAPEWIARQMGHTTTEMLFRVYSRYVPNLTRQDGTAFERLLKEQAVTSNAKEAKDADL